LVRIILEKLLVVKLVKKFDVCYGTWRFINVYTRDCHLKDHIMSQLNLVITH